MRNTGKLQQSKGTSGIENIRTINSSHLPTPVLDQQRKGAHIVIVGNGIAGLTAAVAARRAAPHKGIILVTDQSHPTINTPSLKQFVTGKLEREQLLAYPAGTERNNAIQVVHGRVEEIHAHNRYLKLAHGGILDYGDLLLATGSVPNGLPPDIPGRDTDGVLVLHRLQDYLNLRRRLPEVEDVVVIGGGTHAAETVMCMRQLGIQTHWLIRGKILLSRQFDAEASARLLQHIQQQGTIVYTETEVSAIIGNVGVVAGVITSDQQMIACQLVLVCTGSSPATALAEHCTLPLRHERGRGIIVDDQLRTSVPGIYATGDVAALKNPQIGNYEARAQWYSAVVQGHTAAASITGTVAKTPSFGTPWHATRIGDLSILTVGNTIHPLPGMQVYSDTGKGGYRRLAAIHDRLVGYLSLGPTQADGLAIKRVIDEEISLRDIGDALLKGTFDARRLPARRQTHAMKALRSTLTINTPTPVTSDTLPVLEPALLTLPPTRIPDSTGKLWAYNERTKIDELAAGAGKMGRPRGARFIASAINTPPRTQFLQEKGS